jgi:hypothetical protein
VRAETETRLMQGAIRSLMARAMLAEAASPPPLEVEGGESHLVVQAGGIACVLP